MDQSPLSFRGISSVIYCSPSCSVCLVSHQFFSLFYISSFTKINSFFKVWASLATSLWSYACHTVFLFSAGLSSSHYPSWSAPLGWSLKSPQTTWRGSGPNLRLFRRHIAEELRFGVFPWWAREKETDFFFSSMNLETEELELDEVIMAHPVQISRKGFQVG